ncbi:MAG: SPOR domain-containing protein [Halioglobus sp.]
MAQDFAKKRKSSRASRKTTAGKHKPAKQPVRVWRWYLAGFFSGVISCLLAFLVTLPADPGAETPVANIGAEPPPEEPPKPRFDFYTLLPEQTIDVEVDPEKVVKSRSSPASSTELYLLQAGSFKQLRDADRRRAELLLLGLETKIEEARGDNGRWYRVNIGPFASRSELAKARSLTAAQNIDTLLLKRSKP